MKLATRLSSLALALPALLALVTTAVQAQALEPLPDGTPDATINLGTREGAALVRGEWRTSDTKIVEVDFRSPGADLKPSGPPNRTYDILPHAEGVDFDDSRWDVIDPTRLDQRRSTGKVCFNWYRIKLTIPERIGSFDPSGSTAVFETVVDDYAEIWVDGKLPRELGQSGGNLVKGFNAPNRLVIGRDVKPGQQIQLAIFGINGPISASPSNFIWMRSAKVEFYRGDQPRNPIRARKTTNDERGRMDRRMAKLLPTGTALPMVERTPVSVLRKDAGVDAIVPKGATIEKLAEGFQFIEGPVWHRDGYLLFSDPNANRIYRWSPKGGLAVLREMSGYSGADIAEYHQPGSNGLALDRVGRLTINQHGNRRVVRVEADGRLTVLADRYRGKRLNSPNDLVYKSDGSLYFTDPPFGLRKVYDDPRKELPYSGVFLRKNGKLQLLASELKGPNGLAFSPDETNLYVDNWDEKKKIVMRYPVKPDGTLGKGRVFYDMTRVPGEIALDGLKVDRQGNVYVSGPGGLWILSPQGKHLGTIQAPELPANFAFGDADGKTLYMTARTGLYRMRLNVAGSRLTQSAPDQHP